MVAKALCYLNIPYHPQAPTDTHYGRVKLDMGNQITLSEPKAGETSSQRHKSASIPTVPLGIGEVTSGAQNTNID